MIEASPWAAFGLDITAIILLTLGRPALGVRDAETQRAVGKLAFGLISVLAILAVVSGIGIARFSSVGAAVANLRGESLGVTPSSLDFGSGKKGEGLSASVVIQNYTSTPVRLIGGTSDCSCITTQDMPATIEPGATATVRIHLAILSATPGEATRRIELFTDCPSQRTIRLVAGCRVTE